MIIDLQTRAWSSPEQLGRVAAEQLRQRDSGRWLRLDPTPGELARTMECVSAIFLLGFRSERLGASIPMEFVAEQVRRHPGQIVGIAGIDPLAADPREQIDRARSLGLSGLSLSPSASGFHPTHSAAMRTYELAERHGLPIFVSRPTPLSQSCSMEFDRPLAWDEVCRAFPRLRLVLGGLGHPWIGETLVLLSKHQHVHADLAGVISRP
jgi:predicted TIM-barrel fold metal-dependent hydrolase